MAFNKFDPHHEADEKALDTPAKRRAAILRVAWWVSVVYTAVGFAFIGYWLLT